MKPDEGHNEGPSGRVWLGTAGWSYLPDWVGPFYPEGTSASETLERYVEAFRFVEVDSTFYAAPAITTIERWARIFPKVFRASFKAPKELVQETQLRVPEIPFGHFAGSLLDHLDDRLAAIVVQMQPSFANNAGNMRALEEFVTLWAPRIPLAVEFRHLSWRVDEPLALLRAHGVAAVSQDLHDIPHLEKEHFDTCDSYAYVRLIGRHDGMSKDRIQRPQDEARAWWAERIADSLRRGVRDVFVVANNHYEGHAPATLRTFAKELEAVGADVVPSPGWPDGQVSLF